MEKETAIKDIKSLVANITSQSNQATQDAKYYDNIIRLKRLQDYIESH